MAYNNGLPTGKSNKMIVSSLVKQNRKIDGVAIGTLTDEVLIRIFKVPFTLTEKLKLIEHVECVKSIIQAL